MRTCAALLIGAGFALILTLGAVAQEAKEADPKPPATPEQSSEKSAKSTTVKICPHYPYAFHGSYVSYYTLEYPSCSNPSSMDGPSGLQGNCSDGLPDCVEPMKVIVDRGLPHHNLHRSLLENGLPHKSQFTVLAPGAYEVGQPQLALFDTDERPSRRVLLRLQRIRVNPRQFKPPQRDWEIPGQPFGIGCEVEDDGENHPFVSLVETIAEGKAYVVRRGQLQYQVVITPPAP